MDQPPPNYRREFLSSPHHAALGLLTVGAGFLCGSVLPLIIGTTLYTLGWIYLPDMAFFRRWVDRPLEEARRAQETAAVAEFMHHRDTLIESLAPSRRGRYNSLADVCRDIESAGADSPLASPNPSTDPRLRKLDELMWTFLRLLGIEQSLDQFVETERREDLPAILKEAEAEAVRLSNEVDALKAKPNGVPLDAKQRYLGSRLERLEVLRKRQQRFEQTQENLALVRSEQERLEQQIKLLRADAVATKNADTLSARIDATVEHLDQTNKWISEMDEFKDLVGDIPPTDLRVGYAPAATPPVIARVPRVKQTA